MRWLSDLPIRWKLVLVTVLTSAIVEMIAVGVIAFYIGQNNRSQKVREFSVQAEVLAASLTAPLAFDDVDSTQQYLYALHANPEITAAGAYGSDGRLLAGYARVGAASRILPPHAPPSGEQFRDSQLLVAQPVTRAGTAIGTIYLVVDVETFAAQLARFGALILLATLGSLVIAVPISIRLHAAISDAIRGIAAAASRVKAGDFGFEPPSSTRTDEIGVLVSTFGQMVASLREMMQQERLRALGQMSSGVAHDINNAMSPVSLYTASLLESEPNLSERTRNYLEMVRRVVGDVTATVARLRDFSRKRAPEMTLTPVDLNQMARQVIDLTRARWSNMQQLHGHVIEMKCELADGLPAIMGAEGEIREALTNLIFNAVDAMPDGGTLTLRTSIVQSPSQADRVRIEIADTGIGMDEETRKRCFEPFFTTKGEHGTGLGMAMVYGAVQRHSADIDIDSTPGKGTTIMLTFLARTPVIVETAKAAPVKTEIPRLRILIVDDNPSILDSLGMVLELDGHEISAASGGREGIDKFRSVQTEGKPFEVVITDQGMPYVDGNEVAREIKTASPSTSVVLLTGWGHRMAADGEMPPYVDHILGKPPDLNELRAVLANCR